MSNQSKESKAMKRERANKPKYLSCSVTNQKLMKCIKKKKKQCNENPCHFFSGWFGLSQKI